MDEFKRELLQLGFTEEVFCDNYDATAEAIEEQLHGNPDVGDKVYEILYYQALPEKVILDDDIPDAFADFVVDAATKLHPDD